MGTETYPAGTEFITVNGVKVPLHIYLNGLNRKKKREVLAELRKKDSKWIVPVRADTGRGS